MHNPRGYAKKKKPYEESKTGAGPKWRWEVMTPLGSGEKKEEKNAA